MTKAPRGSIRSLKHCWGTNGTTSVNTILRNLLGGMVTVKDCSEWIKRKNGDSSGESGSEVSIRCMPSTGTSTARGASPNS